MKKARRLFHAPGVKVEIIVGLGETWAGEEATPFFLCGGKVWAPAGTKRGTASSSASTRPDMALTRRTRFSYIKCFYFDDAIIIYHRSKNSEVVPFNLSLQLTNSLYLSGEREIIENTAEKTMNRMR